MRKKSVRVLTGDAKNEIMGPSVCICNGCIFKGTFTAKIDFPIGYFRFTITDADIGSLKSLHTLFDKYLNHMLVKFERIECAGLVRGSVGESPMAI